VKIITILGKIASKTFYFCGMWLKQTIPNTITILNLICGILSLVFSFQEALHVSAILLLIAAVLDFFDGLAARALGVSGELGKQLDSLADVVSFGVAPGLICFQLLSASYNVYHVSIVERSGLALWMPFVAFIIPALSALRLAIFNISDNQKNDFIGMPTPANAMFWIGLPLAMHYQININMYQNPPADVWNILYESDYHFYIDVAVAQLILSPAFLISTALITSFLLVSKFTFISFKMKSLKIKDAWRQHVLFAGSLIIIGITSLEYIAWMSINLIMIFYILLSVLTTFFIKNQSHEV
jgi:CDP-diacylglycerol--serine O-phosphatidyltransferase